MSHTNLQAF